MTKILVSAHAEDIGGTIVEPGGEVPAGADKAVVKRLQAEGKLADAAQSTRKETS